MGQGRGRRSRAAYQARASSQRSREGASRRFDKTAQMRTSSELHALRRLSAAIGADAALTQAAGGNTSIKLDGVMWIKASGTWLAHAGNRDIFVPVKLDLLRQGIDGNDPACETCVDYVDHELNIGNLRPSVETTDNHVARLD